MLRPALQLCFRCHQHGLMPDPDDKDGRDSKCVLCGFRFSFSRAEPKPIDARGRTGVPSR